MTTKKEINPKVIANGLEMLAKNLFDHIIEVGNIDAADVKDLTSFYDQSHLTLIASARKNAQLESVHFEWKCDKNLLNKVNFCNNLDVLTHEKEMDISLLEKLSLIENIRLHHKTKSVIFHYKSTVQIGDIDIYLVNN